MARDDDSNQLYTPAQAGELLGLKESTVRRYLGRGVLQGLRVSLRGDWRVSAQALADFIRDREREARAEVEKGK